ncbi:MAG: carbohydrate binding family 9 domain-containing protein [Acidobacteria bacterium]|nr:carbohydrate binding family 9 domain-containing protein [Acidobacteriota bacterium]
MPMTTVRRSVPLLAGLLLAASQPAGAQSTPETPLGTRTLSGADAEAGAQAVEPPLVLDGNGGSGGFAVMPPSEYYRVAPVRVENGPQIDGRLDEEVWLQAAVIDDFVQQEPAEGEPATERTVVRLLYDAEALYLGVEAYDTEPDGVIATEMRRDSLRLLDEDNFQVILDTFQDRRSGYMFVTSPLGAKLEQQVAEEGEGGWRGRNSNNVNINWDGVWDVVSRRTADGWMAEIAIPMVTLRFPRTEEQVWGVNFMRNIRRKNEQVYWAPISKEYTLTRVSLAGTMHGIGAVNRGLDLRMTPYMLAGGRQDRATGTVAGGGLDGSGFNDYGLDVKYGVASGLNLDLTLNTDFAQVEVDEQQVNLTRFPLFFPEKRDFFLENAGMFNVGAPGSGFGRVADLFFTRRIGLSAGGQPTPIIGGARLTGKVNRHNVAAMNITTGSFGNAGDNFFVGRYSRDILARSKVGGIVIDKQAVGSVFAPDAGGVSHYNRTFAADTTLAVHRNLTMTGFVAKTQTPGLTSGDMASYARATWLSPAFHVYTEFADLQENFNPEVGFVPRLGIRTSKFHGEWNPRPGRFNIRMFDPMWNITYTTDQHNRLLTRRIHNMIGTYFENGSSAMFYFNDHFEQLDIPFPIRNTGVTVPAGTYRFGEWVFSYQSDPSRRLYTRTRYSPQTFFDGTRTDIQATVGLRATSRVSAETIFNRSDVDLPWGNFVADLASLRLDLTLSPTVTLRSLSQYNSLTGELSNSIRFNWIYSPGSDIYIAYDEMRLDDLFYLNPHVRRSPWGDVRNRQIAVKMTYLLSR